MLLTHYRILVVQVHVRLARLGTFDGFAAPMYFVKKGILLLRSIRITPLNFELLLRGGGRPELFLVCDVGVRLHHVTLIFLSFVVFRHILLLLALVMLLHEVVLAVLV